MPRPTFHISTAVDEETAMGFQRVAQERNISVSRYLKELMRQEIKRCEAEWGGVGAKQDEGRELVEQAS